MTVQQENLRLPLVGMVGTISTYTLRVSPQEFGMFEIEVNSVPQCTAAGEMENSGFDTQQATCGMVAFLASGNKTVSPSVFSVLCQIQYLIVMLCAEETGKIHSANFSKKQKKETNFASATVILQPTK